MSDCLYVCVLLRRGCVWSKCWKQVAAEEAGSARLATIGPYSLPPLAEHPPLPPSHLLISVYPAPLLGGGRPVLVAERAKDGDRAGPSRNPQSVPELRPAPTTILRTSSDIKRSPTIAS